MIPQNIILNTLDDNACLPLQCPIEQLQVELYCSDCVMLQYPST